MSYGHGPYGAGTARGDAYFRQLADGDVLRDTPTSRRSLQRALMGIVRERLQGQATYTLHNDPEAAAIVARTGDLAVGPDGPRLRWTTSDADFNKRAGELWDAWFYDIGPGCIDCRQLHDGPHLLKQITRAMFEFGRSGGAVLGQPDLDPEADADPSPADLHDRAGSVQLFSGARIANPNGRQDGDYADADDPSVTELVQGLALDDAGAVRGLHIADWMHGGMTLGPETTVYRGGFFYVPAPQDAGIDTVAPPPLLSLTAVPIMQMAQVMHSVVLAVLKETAESVFRKIDTAGEAFDSALADANPDGEDGQGVYRDRDGRARMRLEADGYSVLGPNESIESVASTYPQQALPAFLEKQLARIGAAYGIGKSLWTGEYTDSFSAAKLSLQMTGRTMETIGRALVAAFVLPVVRMAFFPRMVALGLLPADLPEGWDRPRVTLPSMPEPDPAKAAVRVLTQLRSGATTYRRIAEDMGMTREDLEAELAEDAAMCDRLGLVHPMAVGAVAAGAEAEEIAPEMQGQDGRAGSPEAGGGTPDENDSASVTGGEQG